MNTSDLKPGMKIKTVYGEWYTVISMWDNMIFVGGLQQYVHVDKVIAVK